MSVRFRHIARFVLVSATICLTVGASGVLATMSWQVPGAAKAAIEPVAVPALPEPAAPRSLVMQTAHAYLDHLEARAAAAARMAAGQAAGGNASSGIQVKHDGVPRLAYFAQKCLKKMNRRRHAKLVSVPCKPLQGEPADLAETETESDVPSNLAVSARAAGSGQIVAR